MYWFAFLNRLSRDWTVVSKDEAQQNPYFGFRGWLLLLYLATVGSLIQILIVVFASPDPDLVETFGGDSRRSAGRSYCLWDRVGSFPCTRTIRALVDAQDMDRKRMNKCDRLCRSG